MLRESLQYDLLMRRLTRFFIVFSLPFDHQPISIVSVTSFKIPPVTNDRNIIIRLCVRTKAADYSERGG
jgi:hypothetical protein